MAKEPDCPSGSIELGQYVSLMERTDILSLDDLGPVLMGLYGEVGGIMSSAKKHIREGNAYPGFRRRAEEEFGDSLWYLNAICRRIGVKLESLFADATNNASFSTICAASDSASGAVARIATPVNSGHIDKALFNLGVCAAELLKSPHELHHEERQKLVNFAGAYLVALHASKLSFADVVRRNILKTTGAFIEPNIHDLPIFDEAFNDEERLPIEFKVRIAQRQSGKSYLQWNGVFIGAPLTDNIADPDGYRFHDVFHIAHAAILHWSPVIRSLIQHKRKSKGRFDEEQDSGRAIVVEEGLTAWIFMRAKELNYFEGQKRVSFDIMKTIEEFTAGYEVSECPLKLWERAILQGYEVFRQVRTGQGGWVTGNRDTRTIRFDPL